MQYRINNKGDVFLLSPTPRKFGIKISEHEIFIQNVSRNEGDQKFSTDKDGKVLEKEAIAILKFLIGEKNVNSNGCNNYSYYFIRNGKLDKKDIEFPATRTYIEKTGKAPKWSIKGIYKKGDKLSFDKKYDNFLVKERYSLITDTFQTTVTRAPMVYTADEVSQIVNLNNTI